MGKNRFYRGILFILSFWAVMLSSATLFSQTGLPAEPDTNRIYRSLAEALLNPDYVYRLNLSHRQLDSLPLELFQLKNLKELNLSRNKLESLPAEISNFKNLERLDLANNKLTKLPDEIGQLTQLIYLGLNRNIIESLPSTIGGLRNLEVLELWDNELADIPDEIEELKNLKVLELRGILFSEEQQARIDAMVVRSAKIFMSPSCNCKY